MDGKEERDRKDEINCDKSDRVQDGQMDSDGPQGNTRVPFGNERGFVMLVIKIFLNGIDSGHDGRQHPATV